MTHLRSLRPLLAVPTLLVTLAFASIAAAGDAGPDGSATNTCVAAGGDCIDGIACPGGNEGDPAMFSCAGSSGTLCCLPLPTGDAGSSGSDASTTSACTEAGGECTTGVSCPGGNVGPSCGGAGMLCCLPLPQDDAGASSSDASNTCVAAGGDCVAGSPVSCPGGNMGDPSTYSCGQGPAVCCLPLPQADAGSGTNACVSGGGQCVAVAPGSCPSDVGRVSSLSCGPGVGTECCLPNGIDVRDGGSLDASVIKKDAGSTEKDAAAGEDASVSAAAGNSSSCSASPVGTGSAGLSWLFGLGAVGLALSTASRRRRRD